MISLCIPTFNRTSMVIESFNEVIDLEIISEIIIVDDNSDNFIFNKLEKLISTINSTKIKIFKNIENKGAFKNKLECINKSINDWIILLDSDNILLKEYVYAIPKNIDNKIFYLPSWAKCDSVLLNYTEFQNQKIDKEQYKKLACSEDPKIQCLLNTGNYFFNKNTYIDAIKKENTILECYALDAFYQIYLCFKNIKEFKLNIVPGMHYKHRLHKKETLEAGSFYIENSKHSNEFLIRLQNQIKNYDNY